MINKLALYNFVFLILIFLFHSCKNEMKPGLTIILSQDKSDNPNLSLNYSQLGHILVSSKNLNHYMIQKDGKNIFEIELILSDGEYFIEGESSIAWSLEDDSNSWSFSGEAVNFPIPLSRK